MAIFDHGASSIYPNNLTVNLKEYADPNWELDIPCTMSAQKIPNPYKQNMQTMFKFTKSNLEDIFFNALDLRLAWFKKKCIFDAISFYPNKIKYNHPILKKIKV